jgi:hypothetical protein
MRGEVRPVDGSSVQEFSLGASSVTHPHTKASGEALGAGSPCSHQLLRQSASGLLICASKRIAPVWESRMMKRKG